VKAQEGAEGKRRAIHEAFILMTAPIAGSRLTVVKAIQVVH
jgi:hypothetical protein